MLLAGFFSTVTHAELKIGFIYVTPVSTTGWVAQHDQGRQELEKAMSQAGIAITTRYVENVDEGADAERVIRDFAQKSYDLIITPSFGYMTPTLKVAEEFPKTKFESITGYQQAPNVAIANARYYEGRYLAGVVAGMVSKSKVLGYVASLPIPEVMQGINAFYLGAKSVEPNIRLKVLWINTWYDPPKEREAAISLIQQQADILSFHTASDAVMLVAEEKGKWGIAYHSDMSKVAPKSQLLAITHHWGDYYSQRVMEVSKGQWKTANTWGGIAQGMIKIQGVHKQLNSKIRQQLDKMTSQLKNAQLKVFRGPLYDTNGMLRLHDAETMSDMHILSMDYLIQGIESSKISKN
ncbi:MAG: BMP family ABC transporter substrate-binding protein [Gammaproteobacteria bacterium]|nr:BMP family ABC transporter substrate-binding protein [Gammaproteobacteria bacterium]